MRKEFRPLPSDGQISFYADLERSNERQQVYAYVSEIIWQGTRKQMDVDCVPSCHQLMEAYTCRDCIDLLLNHVSGS
jgi:hypothetical protein